MAAGVGAAEEDAAALVGVGFFAVGAEVVVEGAGEDEAHVVCLSDAFGAGERADPGAESPDHFVL